MRGSFLTFVLATAVAGAFGCGSSGGRENCGLTVGDGEYAFCSATGDQRCDCATNRCARFAPGDCPSGWRYAYGDQACLPDDRVGQLRESDSEDDRCDGADGGADADAGPDTDAEPDVPDADAGADADALDDAEVDADGGTGDRPVGAPCNLAEQCADGLVPGECVTMVWAIEATNGYCTALGCHGDEDCPGGADESACAELFPGSRICLDRCDTSSDCRTSEGYSCLDPDGAGGAPTVCVANCTAEGGCPGGQICDTDGYPPLCHQPSGRRNGQPCQHHAECAAGSYCLAERALFGGWPHGACTQDCGTDADCTAGNGGLCVLSCVDDDDNVTTDACNDDGNPAAPDPNNMGLCMDGPCTRVPDSCTRNGYRCQNLGPSGTYARLVCAPDCAETDACENVGWTCDPFAGVFFAGAYFGYGRCQPPLDTSALGEPCRLTSGCRGAMCVAESTTGYPRGICAEECGFGDACPSGFECSGGGLLAGLCFRPCEPSADDCRSGTRCEDLGWGVVTCVPDCQTNADCSNSCCHMDATGYCDPARQYCMM